MTDPNEGREISLEDIPEDLVNLAQNDLDFAVKLLHRDTRGEALSDKRLTLSDQARRDLSDRLDEVANLSFVDAMEKIRSAGIRQLG
jgi:hypothetical protein